MDWKQRFRKAAFAVCTAAIAINAVPANIFQQEAQALPHDSATSAWLVKDSVVKNTGFNELLGTAMADSQKQYLMIGDYDHGDIKQREWLVHRDQIASLAAIGVKHLFIEESPKLQGLIDSYNAGKISTDEFHGSYKSELINSWHANKTDTIEKHTELMTELFANAKQYGIKIHAVDSRHENTAGYKSELNMSEAQKELSNLVRSEFFREAAFKYKVKGLEEKLNEKFNYSGFSFEKMASHVHEMAKEQNIALQGLDAGKLKSDYAETAGMVDRTIDDCTHDLSSLNSSMYADAFKAEKIKEIANGEKAAIFYGAGHMESNYEGHARMYEALGGADKAVRILPVPHAADMGKYQSNMIKGKNYQTVGATWTDYFYDIGQGKQVSHSDVIHANSATDLDGSADIKLDKLPNQKICAVKVAVTKHDFNDQPLNADSVRQHFPKSEAPDISSYRPLTSTAKFNPKLGR